MRLAVLSDIHGNLTAFEAVLADLKVGPSVALSSSQTRADGSTKGLLDQEHRIPTTAPKNC
jgi:hypothetical protein